MGSIKQRIGMGVFSLGVSLSSLVLANPSYGLPGHSVNEVKTWMQGHPTLRAESNDGLRVHRADVPSRRFTFQASVFPVGGFQRTGENSLWPASRGRRDLSTIRREEFILVDYDQQVTVERLEEALRALYGPDTYADYRRAQSVYSYAAETGTIQGEVRLGGSYAYWVEITPNVNGVVTTGKLNVLLSEDVSHLQSYLERQASVR